MKNPPSPGSLQMAAAQPAAFERLLLVITFLLIFIMAARTPLDSDMWWHLSAGEEMLRSGKILLVDVFSFTRAGAQWTNPSWLADIGLAGLFRGAGYLGIGAAVAGLATLSMALVYAQCKGSALLKSVAVLLGSVVASVVWSPRPQLVSLVLLALTGLLIYLYKWKGKNYLWVLPLVFVLWGNLHGGYPLGLLLLGAAIAGEVLNHILAAPGDRVLSWRAIFQLCGWAVLCAFAVLVNPNGLRMWLLPFQTVDIRVLQNFIPEWASPDFHELLQQALLWLLLLCIAVASLSGRLMDGSDLVTLFGFAYMAFVARRNFGPFALVAVPIFCRSAAAALEAWQARAGWLAKLSRRKAEPEQGRLIKKIINLSLVGLLGLVAWGKLYVVTQPVLVSGYLEQGFPAQAARWLKASQPPGRLLNEYNWGGYLQWSLREFPIFVDGRTDLFNDELVGEWIDLVQAQPGWEASLVRYQVKLVMLEPGRPLLSRLGEAGWERLYADSQVVIYGRK
jgi:hypothetical protein